MDRLKKDGCYKYWKRGIIVMRWCFGMNIIELNLEQVVSLIIAH